MSDHVLSVANTDIAAEDLPEPSGYNLIVEPIEIEAVSRGGIALPASAVEAKEHLRYIGRVVAKGELCYENKESFVNPITGIAKHWCDIGDWVVFDCYAGQDISIVSNGRRHKLKIILDDHIRARVKSPESCLIYE
jgi:co-chaperonin GroES (HSP10)